MDEYIGFAVSPPPDGINVGNNFCTDNLFGSNPLFVQNGPETIATPNQFISITAANCSPTT